MNTFQQQCLLAYLGFSPGAIDGCDGPRTRAAMEAFRASYGCDDLLAAVAGKIERKGGSFWDSVRHFTREEFKCKCGGRFCGGYPAEMREDVVRIADAAREHFGRPGHVVSGLRCPEWNAHEGGVANSQHMYGEAIDLCIEGVDSETLRQFVSRQPHHRYSYRINDTNVHFDIPKVGES